MPEVPPRGNLRPRLVLLIVSKMRLLLQLLLSYLGKKTLFEVTKLKNELKISSKHSMWRCWCASSKVFVENLKGRKDVFRQWIYSQAQSDQRSLLLVCLSFHSSLPLYFGLFSLFGRVFVLWAEVVWMTKGHAVCGCATCFWWLGGVPALRLTFSTLSQTTVVIRIANCAFPRSQRRSLLFHTETFTLSTCTSNSITLTV